MFFQKHKSKILFVALILIGYQAYPQVKNAAFQAMLKTLLSHNVPEISVEKAASDSSVVWLDARARREFEVSHLSGAKWVGYDDFDESKIAQLPHNQRVIVYCSVGYRSEKVTQKLLEMGFTDVQNMVGGIFEWVNEGRPVVDENGSTERVHAYSRTWGQWLRRGKKVYD